MEKFIKYLENQKRLSVELGTPQGEIEVLEAIIKEAKKQLLIHSVSQQRELLMQAYKDGFDSATESIVAANKMVQERKLQ